MGKAVKKSTEFYSMSPRKKQKSIAHHRQSQVTLEDISKAQSIKTVIFEIVISDFPRLFLS